MITPDIAGLCERLRVDIAWADKKPEARTFVTAYVSDLREAADTLERQAAEIKRLRGALERIAADGQPYRNGYCQTDIGIDPAMSSQEAQEAARAALTGEDTAGSPSSQNTEPGLAFSDAGEL